MAALLGIHHADEQGDVVTNPALTKRIDSRDKAVHNRLRIMPLPGISRALFEETAYSLHFE